MKVLKSWFDGAVTITHDGTSVYLNLDESAGGGKFKGILKGQGSISLGVMQAAELGEQDLNKLIPPAFLPVVEILENYANQAVQKLIG